MEIRPIVGKKYPVLNTISVPLETCIYTPTPPMKTQLDSIQNNYVLAKIIRKLQKKHKSQNASNENEASL